MLLYETKIHHHSFSFSLLINRFPNLDLKKHSDIIDVTVPGINFIKLFTDIVLKGSSKLECLSLLRNFHISLMVFFGGGGQEINLEWKTRRVLHSGRLRPYPQT
jgi:hypothetical protein